MLSVNSGGYYIAACALFSIGAASVRAQEPDPTLVQGSLTLDASLGIESLDSDNMFRSNLDERSSRVSVVTPELLLRLEPSEQVLELDYRGELARYDDFPSDDYTDHLLDLRANLSLSDRARLDLIASREDSHEDRGTGLTEGFDFISDPAVFEPDQFEADQLLARFRFGGDRSRASIALEGSKRTREYTNNRSRTAAFNRENHYAQVTLGIALGSVTQLQFVARSTDITYDLARPPGEGRDNREKRYLIGVEWEVTGRTTGTVRVGQVDKEYDDPARSSYSDPSWEAEVRWSPRTYSHIDIGTERFPSESTTLTGDVIDNERYFVSWTHEWTDRIETEIAAETVDQSFREATEGRAQDSTRLRLAVRYAMRDWITWEAGIEDFDRASNLDPFNYVGKVVRLGARIFF